MVAFIKTITLLLIASCLAMAALLVPAHIRSIDQSVIELAGANGTSVENKLWEEVNAAYIGPAQRIAAATQIEAPLLQARIVELLQKNPDFSLTGGPDRSFEDYLKSSVNSRRAAAVIPQLLPRVERAALSATLATSNNRNIAALLNIRDLTGLLRLHPASHAAGAPYDSGVLTLALLIEGGHFQPALAQQIGNLATLAASRNPDAVIACEDFVIGTLSLGRQLDYRSLASLAEMTKTLSDWSQMASLFRAQPERIDENFTALLFTQDPDGLYTYLAEHDETGNTDIDLALRNGSAAVSKLIDSDLPIYRPSTLPATILTTLAPYRPESFVAITLQQNALGKLLKFALLFLAGLAFAFAMGSAWRASIGNITTVSRTNPMVMARDILISLVVVLTIWTFFEPDILKSQETAPDNTPRIEFAVADSLSAIKSPVKAMQELNQVTLLVLALFFIIQLVIYSFGLIKLREISKQQLSADMKIKLLDNEENLFDFGLYVGLGGTVLSLILVAVGIVEASLMAAYASTLFGILFTAMLKVMHLRPYRRKLILEAGSNEAPSTLMKNIEL
ncbi:MULTISPECIES: hypothetical protein [unclassified Lentimonas]|uniref:hypothetical protein n=1 Tax=unclassified Lentimonas TaxID=2630993 RepID=UPI0013265BD3|nr:MULTISPECIES: hypothetical protein [unclassified Lentimonas]CAA6678807.1 Unannotated [Lentimonas sp. CC4]CAA6684411.1 Unannotated [Lentimonas sp. CC6]CAA7077510.1 Unannotated [Lentimonas sp. CC4]CAA7171344.1 Unannotated [Lentimonas sp. CC21]CAA7183374.1 Unannotated [Lentimonas sp. CC8]